ncbi:hypothetical protein QUA82_17490 [Microcoleus sp. F8-D3]
MVNGRCVPLKPLRVAASDERENFREHLNESSPPLEIGARSQESGVRSQEERVRRKKEKVRRQEPE